MRRLVNYVPLGLFVAMSVAAYYGNPPHMAVKLIALFTLLWYVPVNTARMFRGHAVTWDCFAIVAVAGTALIWSMGWLS